jgi:hypothetical protein
MAIQVDNTININSGVYTQPYFRLTLNYPVGGTQVPVDCFVYASKEAYKNSEIHITCWPFYVETADAPEMEIGYTVVDKYLYFVTEKVKESLESTYPLSTFKIVGIPTEAPVTPPTSEEPTQPLTKEI